MSVGQVLNEHDIDTEKVLLCDTDKAIPKYIQYK